MQQERRTRQMGNIHSKGGLVCFVATSRARRAQDKADGRRRRNWYVGGCDNMAGRSDPINAKGDVGNYVVWFGLVLL
ncbi:hypothetical protein CBR_g199 [Chara braunii]|uniref:Uncharacterized protein n=1 Tax=Chara braunii TaxID=69332 RepID=A0A388JLV5_CHABU|nr:hypothetical protein CBR_g199 [Chara braunii]|eukprot:GBG58799.1 hypothetical protein CBR_g199 [Chara braunii]